MGKREYVIDGKTFTVPDMDIGLMERVRLDATNGVPIDKSVEKYTPEMLEYRRYFEAWLKTLPPNAIVDFPQLL